MNDHRRTKAGRNVAGAKERLPKVTVGDLKRKLAEIPNRTERLDMRVSAAEKAMIHRLAKYYDVNVTDLLVALAELVEEQFPPNDGGSG